MEAGMADLQTARKAKATEGHDVIDEAIHYSGEGYTVFSIVSIFFVTSPANSPHLIVCFSPSVSCTDRQKQK